MKKIMIYVMGFIMIAMVMIGVANMTYQKGRLEGYSEGYNDGYSMCGNDAIDIIDMLETKQADVNIVYDYLRTVFSIVAEGVKIN
jgi:hypothetical protein